jgi:hypothetical protein
MEATVMPLPTDETTPPVTKIYFGPCPLPPMRCRLLHRRRRAAAQAPRIGQYDHLDIFGNIGATDRQSIPHRHVVQPHLAAELLQGLQARWRGQRRVAGDVVHRHHEPWLDLAYDLDRLGDAERVSPGWHHQHVNIADLVQLVAGEGVAQVA